MRKAKTIFLGVMLIGLFSVSSRSEPLEGSHVPIHIFFDLIHTDKAKRKAASKQVSENWHDSYTPILIELLRVVHGSPKANGIWKIIEKQTPGGFEQSMDRAFYWSWQNEYDPHPDYAAFKAIHYTRIDRRFFNYFDHHTENATIRLDEIRWGGVVRDGIPPLNRPKMISAPEADYLKDSNIVFGVEINGDARAYPKRILAWHEMFKDVIGGISINGVYCTLCGTVIVYKTEHKGIHHELGTSGFLYRSNKLMYDQATESLWNTLDGEPVVGPLVGQGIKLEPLYLVTTTWGEWKKRHPETSVLSLETGFRRDYGEGVAYNDYFSTDDIMFTTPFRDKRLKNKDEVFVLRFGRPFDEGRAYSVRHLKKKKIVHDTYGGTPYVLISDQSGAIRTYESGGHTFSYKRDILLDTNGSKWKLSEAHLSNENGETLQRLPSHRAFWFGWHAANPDTELIK
ncbi:DUF3179 domain-containing protein [Puniceicoccaceae bacterium K14]|nr:DUF3179 domain-containing protein [Puniceicoccaceae bacterium K14]